MRIIQAHAIDADTLDDSVPVFSSVTGMYEYPDGTKPQCGGISLNKFKNDISLKGIYTNEEDYA
jgi:hypothetical protein